MDEPEELEQEIPEEPAETPEESDEAKAEAKKVADEEKRRAHEEAEAKRKTEWDAKQQEKKAAEAKAIAELAAMSDEDVAGASVQRTGAALERLTRRNMKHCVAEHIQALCQSDPAFARLTMHPRKSMIHCFWYINRKAREYLEQEMKDNQEQVSGFQGGDVPDGMCFEWGVEYFRDLDAQEDKAGEEKFVPKPYYGGGSAPKKKKEPKPKPEPKKPPAPPKPESEQLSLFGEGVLAVA